MKEIWKDIEGYEGRYQISNFGRARTLNYKRTGKTKILKLCTLYTGYCVLVLRTGGAGSKQLHLLVHRLVARAFITKPDGKDFVNHKDGNRLNNKVDNLEWCSKGENEEHKIYTLGHRSGACIEPCPVYCVETGEKYRSISYAAKCAGVCQPTISSAIIHGRMVGGKTYKRCE